MLNFTTCDKLVMDWTIKLLDYLSDAATRVKVRKQKVRNPIDLEVVLEAFQDFIEQYK